MVVYCKICLFNYEVFDEKCYFDVGSEVCVVMLGGVCCGINICVDIWEFGVVELVYDVGVEFFLVFNVFFCYFEKY